jgi:hypothetical protein
MAGLWMQVKNYIFEVKNLAAPTKGAQRKDLRN